MDAARDPADGVKEKTRRAKVLNKTDRKRFLDHLAATCDVAGAAELAGIDPAAIHAARRSDAAFAADWVEALRLGYEVLEMRLVAVALGGAGQGKSARDVALAVKLLAMRRAAEGRPTPAAAPPMLATRDETTAAILAKLRLMESRGTPPVLPAPAARIAIVQDRR